MKSFMLRYKCYETMFETVNDKPCCIENAVNMKHLQHWLKPDCHIKLSKGTLKNFVHRKQEEHSEAV